jgi:hypothetical protein
MSFFKVELFRCKHYTDWIRSLPCANCRKSAPSAPHHRIGWGRVGTVKTSDIELMPLCDACHRNLHDIGWKRWEEENRPQFQMIVETINGAMSAGVLEVNQKTARNLSHEM